MANESREDKLAEGVQDVEKGISERRLDLLSRLSNRQQKFLRAFEVAGTVAGAARASGVSSSFHGYWMKREGDLGDAYRKAFIWVDENNTDMLRGEVIRRSMSGPEDPQSASLLMFELKARRPQMYREVTNQVNIQNNTQINVGELESARKRVVELKKEYTEPPQQDQP